MALKAKLSKMEKELKHTRLSAEAQAGKIVVVVNGAGEAIEIKIEDELLSPSRRKDLEKGLAYAFNQAREAAGRLSQEKFQELVNSLPPEMRSALGGMGMPG